ncbi:MAG: hypothetical protein V3V19_08030 [Cocleimonas sp.]
MLYPDDANIIAIATDYELEDEHASPTKLRLEQAQEIADFIHTFIST